jgi:hypothetical protein
MTINIIPVIQPAGELITKISKVGIRMGVSKTINSAYRGTFQDIPLKNSPDYFSNSPHCWNNSPHCFFRKVDLCGIQAMQQSATECN